MMMMSYCYRCFREMVVGRRLMLFLSENILNCSMLLYDFWLQIFQLFLSINLLLLKLLTLYFKFYDILMINLVFIINLRSFNCLHNRLFMLTSFNLWFCDEGDFWNCWNLLWNLLMKSVSHFKFIWIFLQAQLLFLELLMFLLISFS